MVENPFSLLLKALENRVFLDMHENSDDSLVAIYVQVKLLNVLYRSMMEYDMMQGFGVKTAEDVVNSQYRSLKANLDYFQFIFILNQLGRLLKERKISLPRYNRVRFFRNKVGEHWDEYSKYGLTGSSHQPNGDAAVPSTSHTYLPGERKAVMQEINNLLTTYNLVLEISEPEVGNIADIHCEKLYAVLEKIDQNLGAKIPNELIALLFKFGFPAPIQSVKEYSGELAAILQFELLE